MLLNKNKILVTISMIALVFSSGIANAEEPVPAKIADAFKAESVKTTNAEAIVLAKGQNNLPKRAGHC